MAPVVLYAVDTSGPCRAVFMLAKAIDLQLDVKLVSLLAGEHMKPEYVKMNPQHTVPTMDDNGFILWDSHAINVYLLSKYGKDDSLYPKDLKKRALVDQRLHFDSGVAFSLLLRSAKPLRLKKTNTVPDNLKEEIRDAYNFLEAFLEGNKWVCGDTVTLGDIHLTATISSIKLFEPLTDKYPNVNAWLNNCTKQPWYEENVKGLANFNKVFGGLLKAGV